MRSILRSILAVLLGAVAGGVLLMGAEMLGATIYPLPPGVDPNDLAAIQRVPVGALLLRLLGWIVGIFAGAWIAARLAPRSPMGHGLVLGALFLADGIKNVLDFPYPAWFWVLGVVVFLPAAYFGARLAQGARGDRSLAPA